MPLHGDETLRCAQSDKPHGAGHIPPAETRRCAARRVTSKKPVILSAAKNLRLVRGGDETLRCVQSDKAAARNECARGA